jgi:predicted phosphodiesterase
VEKDKLMQIALISDIHGNLPALVAVLAELDAGGIHQIVCLGDVALFGPQPREVLSVLRELACPMVMGNTDAWALDPQPFEARDEDSPRFYKIELWGAGQLSADDLEYMSSFQPCVEITLGAGDNLFCFHGSPRSNTDAILSTTADDELAPMLSGWQATLMASGHTHTQMLRRFGETTLLNPGSAGLPVIPDPLTGKARSPAWAEYAVVSWQAGDLQIEFRRTAYDTSELIRAALSSGMPHAGWWARSWMEA